MVNKKINLNIILFIITFKNIKLVKNSIRKKIIK